MSTERKTVAEFILPGWVGKEPRYEKHEVPPGDRDPQVPSIDGPPKGAYGVRFFDQVVTEIPDPHGGDPVVCRSDRLDPSPGTIYYQGTAYRLGDILNGETDIPLVAVQFIEQAYSDTTYIIRFPDGTVMPFRKYLDEILD